MTLLPGSPSGSPGRQLGVRTRVTPASHRSNPSALPGVGTRLTTPSRVRGPGIASGLAVASPPAPPGCPSPPPMDHRALLSGVTRPSPGLSPRRSPAVTTERPGRSLRAIDSFSRHLPASPSRVTPSPGSRVRPSEDSPPYRPASDHTSAPGGPTPLVPVFLFRLQFSLRISRYFDGGAPSDRA